MLLIVEQSTPQAARTGGPNLYHGGRPKITFDGSRQEVFDSPHLTQGFSGNIAICYLEVIISGIGAGALYAIIGIGLSLVYGVSGVFQFCLWIVFYLGRISDLAGSQSGAAQLSGGFHFGDSSHFYYGDVG
jgi:hypothetical protein